MFETPYFPVLSSFKVIVSDELCVTSDYVQFRFRKSKKRKSRAWVRKNKANWRHQNFQHKIIRIGDTIYCSRRDEQKIRQMVPEYPGSRKNPQNG